MRTSPDLTAAKWRKSSYSNMKGGDCLLITEDFPDIVPVRDSKNPGGPALVFPARSWSGFVETIRRAPSPS